MGTSELTMQIEESAFPENKCMWHQTYLAHRSELLGEAGTMECRGKGEMVPELHLRQLQPKGCLLVMRRRAIGLSFVFFFFFFVFVFF